MNRKAGYGLQKKIENRKRGRKEPAEKKKKNLEGEQEKRGCRRWGENGEKKTEEERAGRRGKSDSRKHSRHLPINDEGEFRKWQKEVREAEALKSGSISGGAGGDFGRDAGCFKAAGELEKAT
ncbi:hypothetical protein PVL29_000337 [Vitis rotundifolia]|uniref:Uncharacterized protein n=1 Tax=Vitis rotundifolia TaxID=103349 RepID=A0AA39E9P1_VITRO|nr:hypothetical protein PVL29_000337 [Vitis rotundifolia]